MLKTCSQRCFIRGHSNLFTTRLFSAKISVELDKKLEQDLEENKLKPRHHIGINKLKAQTLPNYIISAIEKITGDYPIKTIAEDGMKLNRYIQCRHPPTEDINFKEKLREIENDIEAFPEKYKLKPRSGIPETEEYRKKENEMRKQLIQKLMRQRVYSWQPINYDEYKSLAYLFGRSSQEFAVIMKIFKEIQKRDPQFKPRSYFDYGSGVGTGVWAAAELWKENIFEYYLVDTSKYMNDLSDIILRDGDVNKDLCLKNVYQRQFLPAKETKYDIVLSAYSLFELPTLKNRLEVITNLFNKTANYLILVENGSNAGFKLLNEAREFIMELSRTNNEECFIFSPCPHSLTCPRFKCNDGTPCNFEVLYYTLPLLGGSDIRKELYSYIVIKKGNKQSEIDSWPRIVRPTLVRSKHTVSRMCTDKGKLQEIIFTASKHGKMTYRCARATRWGDQLPVNLPPTTDTNSDTEK